MANGMKHGTLGGRTQAPWKPLQGPETSATRTSLTLVPVGPVTSRAPPTASAAYESLFASASSGSRPAPLIFCAVFPSTIPPAASVEPSLPSVSAENAAQPSTPSSSTASASTNSWFGPPVPLPRTVTVASPPETMAHGGGAGLPLASTSLTIAAYIEAAPRASPVRVVVRSSGAYPSSPAFFVAASAACQPPPQIQFTTFSKMGSSDAGVSSAVRRCAATLSGGSIP